MQRSIYIVWTVALVFSLGACSASLTSPAKGKEEADKTIVGTSTAYWDGSEAAFSSYMQDKYGSTWELIYVFPASPNSPTGEMSDKYVVQIEGYDKYRDITVFFGNECTSLRNLKYTGNPKRLFKAA